LRAAGEQVVDDNYFVAFAEQSIAEMRSQKPGAAGDQSAWLNHAFLAPSLEQWNGLGMRGGASYGIIGEAVGRHHFGIIQVAAVDHDGIFEFIVEAAEIEIGKLFHSVRISKAVGAGSGFVGGAGVFEVGIHHFLGAIHGGGIVGGDLAAFLHQRLHDEDGRIRECRRCRP